MPSLQRFAAENPGHPDLEEMLAMRAKSDDIYRRWGREHCGFAIWALRVT